MGFSLSFPSLDWDLIQKYDTPVPRYTSYPPATELSNAITQLDFKDAVVESNQRQTPLSLYVHIPFCQTACYFCGCNVVVSGNRQITIPYLHHLTQEINDKAEFIDRSRPVLQMHWGGGTPNYLTLEQTQLLWEALHSRFTFDPGAEISIEVNPRNLAQDYVFQLRNLGFNRISFGIQDFNPEVQAAVNRIQSEELLFNAMNWIRAAGFESVNVDLIYGLPFQTLDTFRDTLAKTIHLHPDRIAVFSFAYVPWMKPVQRRIPLDALPSPRQKLAILQMTIEELTQQGYLYIGMDHFAKLGDELAIAQWDRSLVRNFQGYTTKPETELFGFGATSITMLQDLYVQNHRDLKDYYQAVKLKEFPIAKGIRLNADDCLRREIIMRVMSHPYLDKSEIETLYKIDFDRYFYRELEALSQLEQDGLINMLGNRIVVTDLGRLLLRNIAVVFDAYATQNVGRALSKAI